MFELADCDADCFNCAVINLTEWEQDEIGGVTVYRRQSGNGRTSTKKGPPSNRLRKIRR